MRTRQGETIFLGEWIRLASADFPPAGGVWGGMRAGFGLGVFGKFATKPMTYEQTSKQKSKQPKTILLPNQ